MAVGLVNDLFPDRYRAAGAGTDPRDIDPLTVETMKESGIDLTSYTSLRAGQISDTPSDFVVTLCDRASKVCPLFPHGSLGFHKGFPEPSSFPEDREGRLKAFRKLRDEIREWVEKTFS
jgi:arsenate reductase